MINKKLRDMQWEILKIFSQNPQSFALAGGTALELFYLNHRFSRDLDFFSQDFDYEEINEILRAISQSIGIRPEYMSGKDNTTKVRYSFYTIPISGTKDSLKLDFVEDVLPFEPDIQSKDNIPVYNVERIYFQKITTITGISPKVNEAGYAVPIGRKQARDVIDIYYLSKKIQGLSVFMRKQPRAYQRTMVQWHRHFSEKEFIKDFNDYRGALYDEKLTANTIIKHIDGEIKSFMQDELK